MSAARITVNVPAQQVATPRGAIAVGIVATFIVDLLAARKVRQERRRYERDLADLREMARDMRQSSPSLAADLLAAADRGM